MELERASHARSSASPSAVVAVMPVVTVTLFYCIPKQYFQKAYAAGPRRSPAALMRLAANCDWTFCDEASPPRGRGEGARPSGMIRGRYAGRRKGFCQPCEQDLELDCHHAEDE